MAKGFDELIDFLLAEIALCGVQGAGSDDFRRFVRTFYEETKEKNASISEDQQTSTLSQEGLGRNFHEKVWNWLSSHTDVRIVYHNEVRTLSLSEFEALELQETGSNGAGPAREQHSDQPISNRLFHPSKPLSGLRDSLRKHLLDEGRDPQKTFTAFITASAVQKITRTNQENEQESQSLALPNDASSTLQQRDQAQQDGEHRESSENNPENIKKIRGPKKIPKGIRVTEPIFDDPASSSSAPRIYASQSRVWQAITGHGIDLKKVPSMEFMLLSIIATQGPNGVAQPDLVRMSGQDKRSVPHRTDELARKGYIEKKPVQEGKLRTSVCVHKKFIKEGHFLKGSGNEDVFRNKRIVLSGFVHLLHDLLKDVGVVPVRDLRKLMGVTQQNWNQRAVRGAISRLDETGFVKRVRVKKRDKEDWLVCIKLQRPPTDDDINNLKFRRQVASDQTGEEGELLEEGNDGDALMRDIETDMLHEIDPNEEDAQNAVLRIPPQWVPERLLSNLTFDATNMAGRDGGDAAMLRDRTVGRFWKRPMESYLCRLTDNWEKSQPPHLRHLAIVRDTRITQEKKFVHYVYRTYGNFQKAVDQGEVSWEGVSKEATKQPSSEKKGQPLKAVPTDATLDQWGFRELNAKDFHREDGSSTLSECRSAIFHGRRHGQHWDNALTQEMGYQKPRKSTTKIKGTPAALTRTKFMTREEYKAIEMNQMQTKAIEQQTEATTTVESHAVSGSKLASPLQKSSEIVARGQSSPTGVAPLLSLEQRLALGLPRRGRLGGNIEKQIRAHRRRTGDPTSLPEVIFKDGNKATSPRRNGPVLLTKEERIARGLPERGRLGKAMEDQIRQERGLPTPPPYHKKSNTKRDPKEPPLLTKEQRIARGLPPVGRLPTSLIEQLRQERDMGTLSGSPEALPELPHEQAQDRTPDYNRRLSFTCPETPTAHFASPLRGSDQRPPDSDLLMSPTQAESVTPATRSGKGISFPEEQHEKSPQTPRQALTRSFRPRPPSTSTSSLPTKRGSALEEDIFTPAKKKTRLEDTATALAQAAETTPDPFPSTGIRPEDSVITNIKTQPQESSTPPSTRIRGKASPPTASSSQPLPTASEIQAMQISEKYRNRSAPGLYVNPSATRSIGRGRPRKAFIATFKLPRLKELSWFQTDSITPNTKPRPSPTTAKATPKGRKTSQPNANAAISPQNVGAQTQVPVPSSPDELVDQVAKDDTNARLTTASRALHHAVQSKKDGATENTSMDLVKHSQQNAEQIITQNNPPELSTTAPGLSAEQGQDADIVKSSQLTQESLRSVPRGWQAVNSPAGMEPAVYNSPYAMNRSTSPAQNATQTRVGSEENTASVGSPISSAPTPNTGIIEREPSVGSKVQTVGYPRPKKQGAFTSRGVVLGRGSVWRIRTAIIREILERCNGVFPLNGEIVAPFYKLWDERELKNMGRPDRSTLTNTINNMIADPEQKLKKMSFHIPCLTGPTMKEVFIIAYKHLTPSSPEVKQLQHNIIRTYPKRFYPAEIQDLVKDTKLYHAKPPPPIDETIQMDELYPSMAKKLDQKIQASIRKRTNAIAKKQQKGDATRKTQNAEVEMSVPKQSAGTQGGPRAKRARLASLNDGPKRFSRMPLQIPSTIDETEADKENKKDSPALSDSSEDIPLSILRPLRPQPLQSPFINILQSEDDSSSDDSSSEEKASVPATVANEHIQTSRSQENISMIFPVVHFYPTTGTFSTDFNPSVTPEFSGHSIRKNHLEPAKGTYESTQAGAALEKGKKRVRIAGPPVGQPNKRARINKRKLLPRLDDEYVNAESESEETSTSEEDASLRRKGGRHRAGGHSDPTLLERLTGLTGDPNDPIYQPPPREHRSRSAPSWSVRKTRIRNRKTNGKKYLEVLDPVDKFKKLCFTLVIASCMSGGNGSVDWSIVAKVYAEDSYFDLVKTKKLWLWIQKNMVSQLSDMTDSFQTLFLEAYEDSKVASIDDPETYDWVGLVQWALRSCKYPDPPLPVDREALHDFVIDESNYEVLDRTVWYRDNLANHNRTQRLLRYAFVSPLHQRSNSISQAKTNVLKARSWIRSNTATPQALYDGNLAHDKISVLGEPVLAQAVTEYVNHKLLRMRKIKRLLPGRNYSFTAQFAKNYRRPFELSDFMSSVKLKKDLDAAFANENLNKRTFSISRSAEDGTVMAILSLVADGRVKLIPRLPPINSDFNAPLPRLSVWGFCEGDYVHRAIDRQRLFWPVDIVPTSTYRFGNPLQPSLSPLGSVPGELAKWPQLPDPPLPGKNDPNALLPIWSSINGHKVIWPWWYRILNLVIQPLIFQPGATAIDIYRHCPEHTTEVFEIELVLSWLESVHAIKKSLGRGFEVNASFWAIFGDRLIDTEDDWFGEHVKRKKTNHSQWREEYNVRFATLRKADGSQQISVESEEPEDLDEDRDGTANQQIMQNSRRQYRIARQKLGQHADGARAGQQAAIAIEHPSCLAEHTASMPDFPMLSAKATESMSNLGQDVEMANAEGEDVDAEGEIDEEFSPT